MKILLIYNPFDCQSIDKSTPRIDPFLDLILQKFSDAAHDLIPIPSTSRDALDSAISQLSANYSDYNQIIAAGGDETVRLTISLMANHGIKLPLGIYPIGRTNRFAKHFGAVTDPLAQTDALLTPTTTLCPITRTPNNDFFLNLSHRNSPKIMRLDCKKTPLRSIQIIKGPARHDLDYTEEERPKFLKIAPDVVKIIKDLPRHSIFSYVNSNALGASYYAKAARALRRNRYIYLILSSTGSPTQNLIGCVTGKKYNHVSLSFDPELHTMVSYNGGNGIKPPGLNHENLKYFNQREGACLLIYRIKVSRGQKAALLDAIREIDRNGSAYNILGVLVPHSFRENILVCSQFVYKALQKIGISYFDNHGRIHPTDFVEYDYKRRLEFYREYSVEELLASQHSS